MRQRPSNRQLDEKSRPDPEFALYPHPTVVKLDQFRAYAQTQARPRVLVPDLTRAVKERLENQVDILLGNPGTRITHTHHDMTVLCVDPHCDPAVFGEPCSVAE